MRQVLTAVILAGLTAQAVQAEEKLTEEQALGFYALVKWAYKACPKDTLTPAHIMLADAIAKKAPPEKLQLAERTVPPLFIDRAGSVEAACADFASAGWAK